MKWNFLIPFSSIAFVMFMIFFGFYLLLTEDVPQSFLIQQESINKESVVTTSISENTSLDPQVLFCPSIECQEQMRKLLQEAQKSISCAWYDLNDNSLVEILLEQSQEISVKVVIDNRHLERQTIKQLFKSNVQLYSDVQRNTLYNNYMHHKFCVFDEKIVVTGSTNPTENGLLKNNNVLLIFSSKALAQNYKREFNQLTSGWYGVNKVPNLIYNPITLFSSNKTYVIETYFCPQDDCAAVFMKELSEAEKEILFATYVLTYDSLEEFLLEQPQLEVKGIIEERFVDIQGSNIRSLIARGIQIRLAQQPNNMHHKFFVIDEETVITGSVNPSQAGFFYNDENMLIIRNKEIAKQFKQEMLHIYKLNG